jgi:hypothetical protein
MSPKGSVTGWKYGALALLFMSLSVQPVPALAQPQIPNGYQLMTHPGITGGHLVATRPGTGSATALLARALKEVGGFFQWGPEAVGGFRDDADRRAEVFFRADLQRSPVGGIAYAIVGGGTGYTGFVFDSPQTIRQTLPRLMQLSGPAAGAPVPPALNWRDTPFPDGSGSMKIPDGWVITFAQKGMASAEGPHGVIERGIWTPVYTRAAAAQMPGIGGMPMPGPVFDPIDPVTALQEHTAYLNMANQQRGIPTRRILRLVEAAPAPPVPGYSQAAYIDYEYEMSGRRYRCIQYVMLGNVSVAGSWILYTTYVASPSETFSQNLPILLQIWGSSRTAQHVLQERIENAMQSLREAGEIYRQATGGQDRAQQRMHDKWIEVIRGTRILEDSLTGDRRSVNLAWSKDIVRKLNDFEGYDRYREIPLWQLNQ